MSLLSTLNEELVNKMVWFFPRDEQGIRLDQTMSGIVIERGITDGTYIIMANDDTNSLHTVWIKDLEEMELWDEDLERQNSSLEKS